MVFEFVLVEVFTLFEVEVFVLRLVLVDTLVLSVVVVLILVLVVVAVVVDVISVSLSVLTLVVVVSWANTGEATSNKAKRNLFIAHIDPPFLPFLLVVEPPSYDVFCVVPINGISPMSMGKCGGPQHHRVSNRIYPSLLV